MSGKITTGLVAAACLALVACGGEDSPAAVDTAPTIRPQSIDVIPCFNQVIPGTGGTTVAGAVVPDVVTVNFGAASGFPNGRRLTDPVIDVTLAVIFLDLSRHSAATFANIPLNPAANDLPFRPAFPYLAEAQGSPPRSGTTGTGFNFRTDPVGAYVQVDRMGMPAVATALIAGPRKSAYNDGSPAVDATSFYVPDLRARLTELATALNDDLRGLSLTPCATGG